MRGVRLAVLSALVAFVVGGESARAETVYVTANTFSPFGGEPAFISQYAQADGGSLTQLSPWQVATPLGSQGRGSNVAEMVLSADGMSLYAADNFNGRVVEYDVASDGQLTLKSPSFVSLGTPLQFGAEGLALSPDGQSLYVASGDGQVFQFDVDADGLLHPKAPRERELRHHRGRCGGIAGRPLGVGDRRRRRGWHDARAVRDRRGRPTVSQLAADGDHGARPAGPYRKPGRGQRLRRQLWLERRRDDGLPVRRHA
jgi:hypothetical protein